MDDATGSFHLLDTCAVYNDPVLRNLRRAFERGKIDYPASRVDFYLLRLSGFEAIGSLSPEGHRDSGGFR